MILPNFILPTRVGKRWQYSGIDSPEHCVDKQHFRDYPYAIEYAYNNRGFRDEEWPESLQELQKAVWCVGDSFTVGIGQPYQHIWPQVLRRLLRYRTINVSMDGASNDWICRKAADIVQQIKPKYIIVMWSYTNRREHHDTNWSDEQRRLLFAPDQDQEKDLAHWHNLVTKLCDEVSLIDQPCNLVQCTIPNFHPECNSEAQIYSLPDHWDGVKSPTWPRCPESLDEFDSLPNYILKELQDLHHCYLLMRSAFLPPEMQTLPTEQSYTNSIIYVKTLDWARDFHHFDIETSEWLVDQILRRMEDLDSSKNDFLPGSEH